MFEMKRTKYTESKITNTRLGLQCQTPALSKVKEQ